MQLRFRIPPAFVVSSVALVAGGVAYWTAQRYLDDSANTVRRRWEQRYRPAATLVTLRDLPAGHVLAAVDLARRDMPAAFLPSRSLPAGESAQAVGRRLLNPMRAGDPVTLNVLEAARAATLAHQLRTGARAVTVPVDEVSSQAGLVRPGDKVDLMLAEEHHDAGERCVSVRPLLESVKVLATGRATRAVGAGASMAGDGGANGDPGGDRWSGDSYSTITLDVLPEQAQQLAAGQRLGELIPMLRGAGDEAPSGLDPVGSGRGACRPPATAVAAADSARSTGLSIDFLVGGKQPLKVSRHWLAEHNARE